MWYVHACDPELAVGSCVLARVRASVPPESRAFANDDDMRCAHFSAVLLFPLGDIAAGSSFGRDLQFVPSLLKKNWCTPGEFPPNETRSFVNDEHEIKP